MYDIITIGTVSLDIFLDIDKAYLESNKKLGALFCLQYGSKIPIKKMIQDIGGNAANTAVAFSRLNLKTGIMTTLGSDELSARIIEKLKKEGVAGSLISRRKLAQANSSVILDYKKERTILSYHSLHRPIFKKIPQTKWIYLTSVGKDFEKVKKEVFGVARLGSSRDARLLNARYSCLKIAFNPGTWEISQGLKLFKDLLPIVEVLILNKQEASKLTAIKLYSHKAIKSIVQKLFSFGSAIVVITDGSRGAYAYDGDKIYKINALRVKAEEITGAGDSFASGFLSGLINSGLSLRATARSEAISTELSYKANFANQDKIALASPRNDIQQALKWGILNSSFCIQKIGAQNGLLKLKEIKGLEKKYQAQLAIRII